MSAAVTTCVTSRPIGRAVICSSSTCPIPELACVESVLATLVRLRATGLLVRPRATGLLVRRRATGLLAPAGLGAMATAWLAVASWGGTGGAASVAPAGPVSPVAATSLSSKFLGRADPEDRSLGVLLVWPSGAFGTGE